MKIVGETLQFTPAAHLKHGHFDFLLWDSIFYAMGKEQSRGTVSNDGVDHDKFFFKQVVLLHAGAKAALALVHQGNATARGLELC